MSDMQDYLAPNANLTTPKTTASNDWIGQAIRDGRMLSSNEVARLCGYRSRAAFWEWVRREQPPHVRLSRRNIRFPAAAFQAWLDRRDNTRGRI